MKQLNCKETFRAIHGLKAHLLVKVSIFSAFTPSLPTFILILVYLWSQIQLLVTFSQTIITALTMENHTVTKTMSRIFEYFFFENIFDFIRSPELTVTLLALALIYFIFSTLVLLYTFLAFSKDLKIYPFLQKIWRNIVDLHPSVFSFPIHINTIRLLFQLSNDQSHLALAIKTLSGFVLAYNIILSFALIVFFHVPVQTKHPFSTKTNGIQVIDLFLKLLLPLIWYKETPSDGLKILAIIFAAFSCLYRDWNLFKYMPYYQPSAQLLATGAHAILTALIFMGIIGEGLSHTHNWQQSSVTGVLWLLLAPSLVKIYMIVNKRLEKEIFTQPKRIENIYYLLQYLNISKSYSGHQYTRLATSRIDKRYLEYISVIKQSEIAGCLPVEDNQGWSRETQKIVDEFFFKETIGVLSHHLSRTPDSWLCKCALARLYADNEGTYALTSYLIESSGRYGWKSEIATLYTKLLVIRKLNERTEVKGDMNLDIRSFLNLHKSYDEIRGYLTDQLALQVEFWRHFMQEKPKFLQLLEVSRKIKKQSEKFQAVLNNWREFVRIGFAEPLLIYGLYCCFFQYNLGLGQKLIKEYFHLDHKHKHENKILKEDGEGQKEFTSEAIYLIVSSAPNNTGEILNCSGKVELTFGISRGMLIGQSVNTLMPSVIAKNHDLILRNHLQVSSQSILNRTREIIAMTHDGYLIPFLLHVSFNYLSDYGFCYYALLEPVKGVSQEDGGHGNTRLLLMNSDGKIMNFSKDLIEDLDIDPEMRFSGMNILDICPEYEYNLQLSPLSPMIKQKRPTIKDSFHLIKKSLRHPSSIGSSMTGGATEKAKGGSELPQEEASTAHLIKNLSWKEQNLTFYPVSGPNKFTNRFGSSPYLTSRNTNTYKTTMFPSITYKTQIRKFEINGMKAIELKMIKISGGTGGNYDNLQSPSIKNATLKSFKTMGNNFQLDGSQNTITSKTNQQIDLLSPLSNQNNTPLITSPRDQDLYLKKATTATSERFNTEQRLYSVPNREHNIYAHLQSPHYSENYPVITSNAETYGDLMTSPGVLKKKESLINSPTLKVGTAKGDTEGISEADLEDFYYQDPYGEEGENKKESTEVEQQQEVDEKFLKEILMQSSMGTESRSLFENAKVIRKQEILRKMIESKAHSTHTKIFISSYVATSAVLLAFLIWLNSYTSGISGEVGDYSEALQDSHFRSYWNKIALQDTGYWLAAELGWVDYPADVLADGFKTSFGRFLDSNKVLQEAVGDLSVELQELFAVKNVRILERNGENELEIVAMDDTFQASNRIINQGLINIYQLDYSKNDTETLDGATLFLFDNSLDDLQIISERLTNQIKASLFDIFDHAHGLMVKYLIATFVVLLAFVLFSLQFIVRTNLETKHFVHTLYGLQMSDIKRMEHLSSKFKEVLDKDFQPTVLLKNLQEIKAMAKYEERARNKSTKRERSRAHDMLDLNRSLRGTYLRNYLLFIGLFLCLSLSVVFTWIYFDQAAGQLDTMKVLNTNINSALEYVNIVAWTSIELQLLLLKNGTTTTRNQSIFESISSDVEKLKDVDNLQNSLKDQNGDYSAGLTEILFKFPCTKSYTPYYSYPLDVLEPECDMLSDGTNYVGLLSMISRLGMEFTSFLPQFAASPRTEADLIALYDESFNNIVYPLDINFVLLLNAYQVAIDDFAVLVVDLGDRSLRLAWIAVVVTVFLGALTWVFVMRKILKMDFESRLILALIPGRLVLQNFQMKRYVVRLIGSSSNSYEAMKLLR